MRRFDYEFTAGVTPVIVSNHCWMIGVILGELMSYCWRYVRSPLDQFSGLKHLHFNSFHAPYQGEVLDYPLLGYWELTLKHFVLPSLRNSTVPEIEPGRLARPNHKRSHWRGLSGKDNPHSETVLIGSIRCVVYSIRLHEIVSRIIWKRTYQMEMMHPIWSISSIMWLVYLEHHIVCPVLVSCSLLDLLFQKSLLLSHMGCILDFN